jgi:hypothetical protein
MSGSVQSWHDRLVRGLDALTHPLTYLQAPDLSSGNGHSDVLGTLTLLLDARQRLGMDDLVPDPLNQCAQSLGSRVAGVQVQGDIQDGAAQALEGIYRAVSKLIENPQVSSHDLFRHGIVRVSDFSELYYLDLSPLRLYALDVKGASHQGVFVVAALDKLHDPEHPLRRAMPDPDDNYLIDIVNEPPNRSAVLLGFPASVPAVFGRGRPLTWYAVEPCLRLTKWARRIQREQAAERQRILDLEDKHEREERERWENERIRKYPLTEIRNLRKKIADLEAQQAQEPVTVASNDEADTTQVTEVVP